MFEILRILILLWFYLVTGMFWAVSPCALCFLAEIMFTVAFPEVIPRGHRFLQGCSALSSAE